MATKKEDKNFFNVADLTEATRNVIQSQNGVGPAYNSVMLERQVMAQLAIAQQLSVISGTLKDLLVLCKSQSRD